MLYFLYDHIILRPGHRSSRPPFTTQILFGHYRESWKELAWLDRVFLTTIILDGSRKKTYCKPLQWPDVWVLHPGQIYLVHTVPRIIDDNSFTSHPKYALQSLPGFAEVFYRWDSLLGGLFVAGLGGAIQYMHDRFLEQKSGKKSLRCLRDWKCGSDWRPFLWGVLSSINSTVSVRWHHWRCCGFKKSLCWWCVGRRCAKVNGNTHQRSSITMDSWHASCVNVGFFAGEFAWGAILQQKDMV